MACVNHIADGLSDEVCANRVALQIKTIQLIASGTAITVVVNRLIDLEVIAPTS